MSSNNVTNSSVVLVTGATAGIGRALAIAIAELPHKPRVIGVGRREGRLKELESKGLETIQLDVGRATRNDWEQVLEKYPNLDTIILNAGIQRQIDLTKVDDADLQRMAEEMNTNYTSIVASVAYTLPHFQKRSAQGLHSMIVTVTSGLSTIPVSWVANYAATKAALRSYTMSLRAALHDTKIRVVEISPPLVESELHDDAGTTGLLSKIWMPLDEFTRDTIAGLSSDDMVVTTGSSTEVYKKYGAGADEAAIAFMKAHTARLQGNSD